MERRSFMLGLFALSAGAAGLSLSSRADAAVTVSAEDVPAKRDAADLAKEGTAPLPEGLPAEFTQYRRRRRRRQVCTVRRNRWGRRVRVCRTVWY